MPTPNKPSPKPIKTLALILTLVLAPVLVGCATQEAVRIDAASEATFNDTFSRMSAQLSRDEQVQLMIAVLAIASNGYESASDFLQDYPGGAPSALDIKDQIDGLTYGEILALAEESTIQIRELP